MSDAPTRSEVLLQQIMNDQEGVRGSIMGLRADLARIMAENNEKTNDYVNRCTSDIQQLTEVLDTLIRMLFEDAPNNKEGYLVHLNSFMNREKDD